MTVLNVDVSVLNVIMTVLNMAMTVLNVVMTVLNVVMAVLNGTLDSRSGRGATAPPSQSMVPLSPSLSVTRLLLIHKSMSLKYEPSSEPLHIAGVATDRSSHDPARHPQGPYRRPMPKVLGGS